MYLVIYVCYFKILLVILNYLLMINSWSLNYDLIFYGLTTEISHEVDSAWSLNTQSPSSLDE